MLMNTTSRTEQLLNQLLASLRPADLADAGRTQSLLALARQMADADVDPSAASRETLVRLGDRWSPLLLFVLSTGRYRHGELRRVVNALSHLFKDTAISQRMLTLRLRVLERDGLVARAVSDAKVPTVDYWLTPMGESFMQHLYNLMHWCAEHSGQMRAAQQAFDAQANELDAEPVSWRDDD